MNNTAITFRPASQPASFTDAASAISAFISSQRLALTSVGLYKRTLETFFCWIEQTGRNLNSLTVVDIVAYVNSLEAEGKSSLTIASYLNSVKRFYTWAASNLIYPNIAESVKAPRRCQEFRHRPLSINKTKALLLHEQGQSSRDYAIINLMTRTGLRCVEVSRANIGDVTFIDDQRVLMVRGKGHTDKDSFVQLDEGAWEPIREYLQSERKGDKATEPLFTSVSNHTAREYNHSGEKDFNARRMTTRAISGIAKKGLRAIGLDDHLFSAHSLRHTAGTNVLRAGGKIEDVQFMLRHASPATTQIYTATVRDERRIAAGGEHLLEKLYSSFSI